MIRQVAMLHLREGADGDAVEAFERAMIDAHEELPGASHSHLGRHMEGLSVAATTPGTCSSGRPPEGDCGGAGRGLAGARPVLRR